MTTWNLLKDSVEEWPNEEKGSVQLLLKLMFYLEQILPERITKKENFICLEWCEEELILKFNKNEALWSSEHLKARLERCPYDDDTSLWISKIITGNKPIVEAAGWLVTITKMDKNKTK